jgi:DNA-binding LacI/PurR family transcriptional regulator
MTALRPPRMTDVAEVAGVSHQTVSRVINEAPGIRPSTRARVLAAIEQLGYRRDPAAWQLASRRTRARGPGDDAGAAYDVAALAEKVTEAALDEWRASGGTADLEAVFLACAESVRR